MDINLSLVPQDAYLARKTMKVSKNGNPKQAFSFGKEAMK
jgi:hypothetical protein